MQIPKIFLILISSLLSTCAPAQSIEDRIRDLGLVRSERVGNYEFQEVRSRSFYVSNDNDEILIREPRLVHTRAFPPVYSNQFGKYIGTDGGEWGGDLIFESVDGSQESILPGENIFSIVPLGDRAIYIMTGWEHIYSSGKVYIIPRVEEPTVIEKYTELPNAPIETLKVNSRVLVIGDETILNIHGLFEVIALNPWKGLYPTSAVQLDKDTLLVGLRGGLAVVDMTNYFDWNIKVYVEPQHRL